MGSGSTRVFREVQGCLSTPSRTSVDHSPPLRPTPATPPPLVHPVGQDVGKLTGRRRGGSPHHHGNAVRRQPRRAPRPTRPRPRRYGAAVAASARGATRRERRGRAERGAADAAAAVAPVRQPHQARRNVYRGLLGNNLRGGCGGAVPALCMVGPRRWAALRRRRCLGPKHKEGRQRTWMGQRGARQGRATTTTPSRRLTSGTTVDGKGSGAALPVSDSADQRSRWTNFWPL